MPNYAIERIIQSDYPFDVDVTVTDRITYEENEIEFYRLIEVILLLLQGYKVSDYIRKVEEAVEISDVNCAIKAYENKVILYPKGEEKLDEELVNYVLSFLDESSNKHFEDALKFYQSKNWVKSAESLRRSLEEFLRFKLKNKKGLKENIGNLEKKLKDEKNSSKIRNIIFQVFNYLDSYFNENSKHNDGKIDEVENEFLIYQVSLLMRYIELIFLKEN